MSMRTLVLAAAAAGVAASLYARSRYLNGPRPLRGGTPGEWGEPGESDELLGSAAEQEQPGEWDALRSDDDAPSGLGRLPA